MHLLFLGAGASSAFGIPTMSGFIELFDREFQDLSLYDRVRKGLGKSLDLEGVMTVLDDFSKPKENLLRTISAQTFQVIYHWWLDEDLIVKSGRESEAASLLKRCGEIIRLECQRAVRERKDEIVHTYDQLFGRLSQSGGSQKSGDGTLDIPSAIWVFTTNYDTCLEVWAKERQIEFDRGVRPRYTELVFDASTFSGNHRLYKLHGSIDMFSAGDEVKQMSADPVSSGAGTFLGENYGEPYQFYPIEYSG